MSDDTEDSDGLVISLAAERDLEEAGRLGREGAASGRRRVTAHSQYASAARGLMGLDAYYTPRALAVKMARWAKVGGLRVLEPGCGPAVLIYAMNHAEDHEPPSRITALDVIDHEHAVWEAGGKFHQIDFLKYDGWGEHDLAVMNPPYGEGQDGRHVGRACRMCPRVVALVRANFLWGKGRYHDVFRWARLKRVAILVRRPNFHDPQGRLHGDGARHDYCVIELEREVGSTWDRLSAKGKADKPSVEWWTEDWNAAA